VINFQREYLSWSAVTAVAAISANPVAVVTFSNKVLKKIHSNAHSYGVSELNAQALTASRVKKLSQKKFRPIMGIVAIKKGKNMERPIISFEEFEEIFEDMAFDPEEISFFVNTLLNATDDNVPAFYYYDGVSFVVTPNEVTVDCDIIYKDICVEVALLQSDYEISGINCLAKEVEKEMLEEWKRWEEEDRNEVEKEAERWLTLTEEEIIEEFLKESEKLKEKLNKK